MCVANGCIFHHEDVLNQIKVGFCWNSGKANKEVMACTVKLLFLSGGSTSLDVL